MAGPLLIIGKTHAQDNAVSPSHDPGECIVCPLAYGPYEACGGYSDYDYNKYWLDEDSPPTPDAASEADPELEVAQSLTDRSTEPAWESGYEDYYADYAFGDDSTTEDSEDATLDETPAPVALIDPATLEDRPANESWSDEEAWYDEYGYEGVFDDELAEASADSPSLEPLETGYDAAYDEAMATDSEVATPVTDIVPATPSTQLPETDDSESFYDAYDDLFNFESTPAESFPSESNGAGSEPEVEQHGQRAMDSEPAWLTELVHRMLAPFERTAGGILSNTPTLNGDSHPATYVDECAQEWDCEAGYWAQSHAEQPSAVLRAADALDGMAFLLQNAAERLRGVAGGRPVETARTAKGGSAH
jgi:hypothetical protein